MNLGSPEIPVRPEVLRRCKAYERTVEFFEVRAYINIEACAFAPALIASRTVELVFPFVHKHEGIPDIDFFSFHLKLFLFAVL